MSRRLTKVHQGRRLGLLGGAAAPLKGGTAPPKGTAAPNLGMLPFTFMYAAIDCNI